MQILSNVPFEDIRVGDRVKSMDTGVEGVILEIIPRTKARRFEDDELFIS